MSLFPFPLYDFFNRIATAVQRQACVSKNDDLFRNAERFEVLYQKDWCRTVTKKANPMNKLSRSEKEHDLANTDDQIKIV